MAATPTSPPHEKPDPLASPAATAVQTLQQILHHILASALAHDPRNPAPFHRATAQLHEAFADTLDLLAHPVLFPFHILGILRRLRRTASRWVALLPRKFTIPVFAPPDPDQEQPTNPLANLTFKTIIACPNAATSDPSEARSEVPRRLVTPEQREGGSEVKAGPPTPCNPLRHERQIAAKLNYPLPPIQPPNPLAATWPTNHPNPNPDPDPDTDTDPDLHSSHSSHTSQAPTGPQGHHAVANGEGGSLSPLQYSRAVDHLLTQILNHLSRALLQTTRLPRPAHHPNHEIDNANHLTIRLAKNLLDRMPFPRIPRPASADSRPQTERKPKQHTLRNRDTSKPHPLPSPT